MTLLSDDGADYVALLSSDWGMSVDSRIVRWMQVNPWKVGGGVALWCHRSARVAYQVWKKACYTLIAKPVTADEDKEHKKQHKFFFYQDLFQTPSAIPPSHHQRSVGSVGDDTLGYRLP